ncbi:FRG domain-containing protein [Methylophilus sp. QUAN]|uniref:FRG domain-containing protein n=1 Tax=Methylophilus sp. QUAN TaxID=2781020 RepID=UPI00188DD6F9|nr:FRG domain-containing protein [Methylophilus sp. QUAN]MBF4990496.1 FRG domain-containing protein [Methylophilus sp. QUAN]
MVTTDTAAWQNGCEEYSKSRFLEYTTDDIASKFQALNSSTIEELKSYPCLCTYEGEWELWVAKITSIEVDKLRIRVFVEIDQTIDSIPFASFKSQQKRFGVSEWEFFRTHWAIKEGDLFEKLHFSGLSPQATASPAIPPTPIHQAVSDVETIPTISSVTEYIQTVMGMKESFDRECFYRGQPDETYLLKPGIFRTDRKTGIPLYRDYEHDMFREILISNSFEFREDSSTLDRLVRMQHHSLPTRLLDITINPLIALYFAVWTELTEKRNVSGQVVLFFPSTEKVKYFDSDTASCIANLALMSASERDQIKFDLKEINQDYVPGENKESDLALFNDQEQIKRLLHYIGSEKPFFKPRIRSEDLRSVICVKSKRSNERISSQSGAFLLFGHDVVLNEDGTDEIKVKRIRVQDKDRILRELEQLNITESTVFPSIVNAANDIARKYRRKSEESQRVEPPVAPN